MQGKPPGQIHTHTHTHTHTHNPTAGRRKVENSLGIASEVFFLLPTGVWPHGTCSEEAPSPHPNSQRKSHSQAVAEFLHSRHCVKFCGCRYIRCILNLQITDTFWGNQRVHGQPHTLGQNCVQRCGEITRKDEKWVISRMLFQVKIFLCVWITTLFLLIIFLK